jgi:hypothetical protein
MEGHLFIQLGVETPAAKKHRELLQKMRHGVHFNLSMRGISFVCG